MINLKSNIKEVNTLSLSEYEYANMESSIKIGEAIVNVENACHTDLRYVKKSTELIDQFLTDRKYYMIFSGFVLVPKGIKIVNVELVGEISMMHEESESDCSFTEVKKHVQNEIKCGLIGIARCNKKLIPLFNSILESLPELPEPGIYKIKEPKTIMAQCSKDRYGFYKKWYNWGESCEEKNYGCCSANFEIIAVIVN